MRIRRPAPAAVNMTLTETRIIASVVTITDTTAPSQPSQPLNPSNHRQPNRRSGTVDDVLTVPLLNNRRSGTAAENTAVSSMEEAKAGGAHAIPHLICVWHGGREGCDDCWNVS